jgi:EcsC protein family
MNETPNAFTAAILSAASSIPRTTEACSVAPRERASTIQRLAALKAGAVAGTLALPAGPLGLLTIIPDLMIVWRIQTQMVADIAGAYGKTAYLTQEQMLYCLFRHAAAQVVGDLMARVGERVVFRRASRRILQQIAKRVGIKVSQRVLAKFAVRWIPVIGAVGLAGYAYHDTARVAATAIDLFEKDIRLDSDSPGVDGVIEASV